MNVLNPKSRLGAARLLIALALLLSGLATLPTSHALPSSGDFTYESGSAADTIDNLDMSGGNNKVGIVYEGHTTHTLGFTLKTGTGNFVLKNADIGAGKRIIDPALAFVSGSTWLAAGKDNAAANLYVYRSTDDGTTWTQVDTQATFTSWNGDLAMLGNTGAYVWLDATPNLRLRGTTDGGATWGTTQCLSDNEAAPNTACAATHMTGLGGANAAVSIIPATPNLQVLVAINNQQSTASAVYGLTGDISTNFFALPYTSNGGSTLNANEYELVSAGGTSVTSGVGLADGNAMATFLADIGSNNNDHLSIWDGIPGNSPVQKTIASTLDVAQCSYAGARCRGQASNGATEIFLVRDTSTNLLNFYMRSASGNPSFTIQNSLTPAGNTATAAWMNATKVYAAYVDPTFGNIKVAEASVGAQGIPSAASVSVSALSAMDVDATGTTVIARTNSGQTVRTFSGSSLTQAASLATHCATDTNYGISALQKNVVVITCNASTNLPDNIQIKNVNLGDPSRPSNCDSNHPLDDSSYHLALNSTLDDAMELQSLKVLSIDFENSQNRNAAHVYPHCNVQYGMAATTSTGLAGVITFDSDSPPFDPSASVGTPSSAFSLFDPTSGPVDEVCLNILNPHTPADPTGFHLFAADSQANTKDFLFNQDVGNPQVFEHQSLTGTFNGAMGIACNKREIIAVDTAAGQVAAYNLTSNSIAWSKTILAPKFRGITASLDNQVAAYVDGSRAYVVGLGNGTVLCTADLPAGTFKDIRLSDQAQNMWIATDSEIDRFPLSSCVGFHSENNGYSTSSITSTATDISTDANGVCLPGHSCPGGVLASGSTLPAGWTVTAFNGLLGLLLVAGVAGGLFFLAGSVTLAAVGAGIGYLMAFFFGLLPLWPIVVLVVFAVAFVFLKVKGGT